MSNNLYSVFHSICKEANIDKEVVLEALTAGLSVAARKHFGISDDVTVQIEEDNGVMEVLLVLRVVDDPSNDYTEITVEEARDMYDPDLELGDQILEELDVTKFGRTAALIAKQIIGQRLKDVQRQEIYDAFKDREGEIITGVVQQIGARVVYVTLGKTFGILPYKEQARGEEFQVGERLKVYIKEVKASNRDCQVILSRCDPRLVEALFRLEVPEMDEGLVEVVSIAREAGDRTKLAVRSSQEKIDPMGACVGVKGSRVHAIVQELRSERIDIVRYNEDPAQYIAHALTPAKLSNMTLNHGECSAVVVVAKDQLSLAIGRRGQNVRLASQLTGWKINIISEEKYKEQGRESLDQVFNQDLLNDGAVDASDEPSVGLQQGDAPVAVNAAPAAEVNEIELTTIADEVSETVVAKEQCSEAAEALAADFDIEARYGMMLIEAGYDSKEKVAKMSGEELADVAGINPSTIETILAASGKEGAIDG